MLSTPHFVLHLLAEPLLLSRTSDLPFTLLSLRFPNKARLIQFKIAFTHFWFVVALVDTTNPDSNLVPSNPDQYM